MHIPLSEGKYSIIYVFRNYPDESCKNCSFVTDDECINSFVDSIAKESISEAFIKSFWIWISTFENNGKEWRVFSEGVFEYFGNNAGENNEFNVHPKTIKFFEINDNVFPPNLEIINWNIDKSMDNFYNREITDRVLKNGKLIPHSRRDFHCDTKYENGTFCPEKPAHLLDVGNDEHILLCQTCAFDFLMKEYSDRLKDF